MAWKCQVFEWQKTSKSCIRTGHLATSPNMILVWWYEYWCFCNLQAKLCPFEWQVHAWRHLIISGCPPTSTNFAMVKTFTVQLDYEPPVTNHFGAVLCRSHQLSQLRHASILWAWALASSVFVLNVYNILYYNILHFIILNLITLYYIIYNIIYKYIILYYIYIYYIYYIYKLYII